MIQAATVRFSGQAMMADVSGALYWQSTSTLIVSDLHFEKGSALAGRRQRHLPPYDTRETLACLRAVLDRYRPRRVISLGDSFHDLQALDRMDPADRRLLDRMVQDVEWIWITGNHDPLPASFAGRVEAALTLDGLVFRHQAAETAAGEISGHYHPKASIVVAGNRVSGKCFVWDDQRLIMPAFGAYTGGLTVLDPAISDLLLADFQVAIIGRQRVVCLPRRTLVF